MLTHNLIMKYLGLLLTILSWVGASYLLAKQHQNRNDGFSARAASSRRSSLVFAGVLGGTGSLFYLWLLSWFVPRLGLSSLFVTLLTITFVAQLVTGFVPNVPVVRQRVHRVAGWFMAVMYLPLSFLMLRAPNIQTFGRDAGVVCSAYLVISGIIFLSMPKAKTRFLVFQALYIGVFQLQILLIAYSGHYS